MKVDFSKVIELSHDMIPSAPTADVKPFDHSPEAAPFDRITQRGALPFNGTDL